MFHDHYYGVQKTNNTYQKDFLGAIIKDGNREELSKCFGYNSKLETTIKMVKTNLVDFIKPSPLYFNAVLEDIKKNKNLNNFFSKYLDYKPLPAISGSLLSLTTFFLLKNKPKIRILSIVASGLLGGGLFWAFQNKKRKETEIMLQNYSPNQQEIKEYYSDPLVDEKKNTFKNKVIERLVLEAPNVYNKLNKEYEIKKQIEEKRLAELNEEKAELNKKKLESIKKTNLSEKNRKKLNEALQDISSKLSFVFGDNFDDIHFEKCFPDEKTEYRDLIKNIFELIYVVNYKHLFYGDNTVISICQCAYNLNFDEHNNLCIIAQCTYRRSLLSLYNITYDPEDLEKSKLSKDDLLSLYSFALIKEQRTSCDFELFVIPSIIKKIENNFIIDEYNMKKLWNLIISYEYDNINYAEESKE